MKFSPQARVSALMLAFLASLLGLIAVLLTPSHQLREWRSAPGHVESSRMLVESSPEHPDQLYWQPHVQYLYTVRGQVYHSDRLFAVDNALPGDRSNADDLTRRFPADKAITVYYNPRSPAESVLIKGGDSDIGSAKFILAALSALFGWALLYRLRAKLPLPRRRIHRNARSP
ncbi:DUF3592 domain-containing protein [Chromobacterium haemolyticum]|uniref:DUF3592 domain-containing protein n=1 Tax=Chromobacterium haemolyticum TaxID=394935 RepID=UPI0009D9A4AB|nr:DUF3592 domain-containing protein [Chromobacterium haemolyticum]OQS37265.1 hypothetical protein B0T39_15755 [Chromobacterium haemolyticum]